MRSPITDYAAPLAVATLLLWGVCGLSRAEEADPPGRAARLSVADGSVSLQPAGVTDWTAATLNRPLTTGDRLWSDRDSRAELDIGEAVIRLGPTTGFSFLNLDDHIAQMQLSAGTLIVRVRDLEAGDTYEVDTPNVALLLQQPGEYRVEVNDAGDLTVVKVSQGAVLASGTGQSVAINAQQKVSFTGTDTLAYQSATLGPPDELDGWSAERERVVEDSASREYVADNVAGTQDLDNNGTWLNTPEYGFVWMPTVVAVGWVPYRFGHWVWIAPWGWTWVDDARWGYTPFHYGRWMRFRDSWCWLPGPRRGRPVYAPALVGWVSGPQVGAARAFGPPVGWFPLGPREVYVPAYRVSQTYVRTVNITNTTLVNNTYITNVYEHNLTPLHYVNNTAAAVTAVRADVFASGQRVGTHALHLTSAALAGAAVAASAPAIAPIRQSVLGPALGHGPRRPPAALLERPLTVRLRPPRAPASLENQIAAIHANGNRPLARAELAALQPATAQTPLRVVDASRSAPMLASPPRLLPSSAAPVRASGAPRAADADSGLAQRERAMQSNRVTGTPAPNGAATPPAAQWRSDRPASAQQHPLPQAPRALASEASPRAYSPPAVLPSSRPPAAPAALSAPPVAAAPPAAAQAAIARPSATASDAPHTIPPAHLPGGAPAARERQSEARGAGPHADRESRERGQR
jgi:hypothetical protein